MLPGLPTVRFSRLGCGRTHCLAGAGGVDRDEQLDRRVYILVVGLGVCCYCRFFWDGIYMGEV